MLKPVHFALDWLAYELRLVHGRRAGRRTHGYIVCIELGGRALIELILIDPCQASLGNVFTSLLGDIKYTLLQVL